MEYNIAQILYDEINRIREKFDQELKSYRQLTSYFGIKLYHSDLDNNVLAFYTKKDDDYTIVVNNNINIRNKKIILLRLFYQHIVDAGVQRTYQDFLSVNFLRLSTDAIYDFVFSGWLILTSETAEAFLKGILIMNGHQAHGVHAFPDPVEEKLECAYLLYINDIITDITILKGLTEGRPHLDFLLYPENFDYSQVDFSNYMWENFARHEKYMKCFITHKDSIIPQIKERIEKNDASEAEKRILYGFLLNGDDVWKI